MYFQFPRKSTKKNALVQIFKTQMHYFFYFVTKTGVFATSALVFMALNLICYVLHKPLLFPLFTHSSCFSLVPFADSTHFSSPQMSFFIIGLNVYGIGYFAMRLLDDELSGINF